MDLINLIKKNYIYIAFSLIFLIFNGVYKIELQPSGITTTPLLILIYLFIFIDNLAPNDMTLILEAS
jgi:hypothetical protein